MFCNSCGNKLSKGEKHCRACGAPADQGETCGGFWGLVGTNPPAPPAPPAPPTPPAPPANPVVKKENNAMRLWYGLVAVLAVLLLIQTIRVSSLNGELKNQESLARQYREWYTQASQENELLNEQLDSMTGGLQVLQDDVAQIKELLGTEETTVPTEPEETEITEEIQAPTEDSESQPSVPETEPQSTEVPGTGETEAAG